MIYLNHGSMGQTLPESVAAMRAWETENGPEVWGSPDGWKKSTELEDRLREEAARFVGGDPGEIALTGNTSEGVSLVAFAFPWQPGDAVIVTEEEHHSGTLPWQYFERERGLKVHWVPFPSREAGVEPIARLLRDDPAIRLVCVSHVSWMTGAVAELAEVSRLAAPHGVAVLVDGAQAVGQVLVDVRELGCQFYAFPGHKWLRGPEGTGGLWIERPWVDKLKLAGIGWASVSACDRKTTYTLHPGARRFEQGTASGLQQAGFLAALRQYRSLGPARVLEQISALRRYAVEKLSALPGCRLATCPAPARPSGLLSFFLEGQDPALLATGLWEKHRVVVRSIPGTDRIRISLHYTNTREDVDRLLAALAGRT